MSPMGSVIRWDRMRQEEKGKRGNVTGEGCVGLICRPSSIARPRTRRGRRAVREESVPPGEDGGAEHEGYCRRFRPVENADNNALHHEE
jgi:hypothetical protein